MHPNETHNRRPNGWLIKNSPCRHPDAKYMASITHTWSRIMNAQYTKNEYRASNIEYRASKTGFVLPLVLIAMVILISLAFGEMMASFNSRMQAVQTKSQTEAMLAAEAGYERAIFWMSQQKDILGALQDGTSGSSGNIDLYSFSWRHRCRCRSRCGS